MIHRTTPTEYAQLIEERERKTIGIEELVSEPQQSLIIPLNEFLNEADTDESAADWLVSGYVGHDVVTGLAGKPKAGKTTFCMHLALAVAGGMAFLGRPTRQAKVLWLNLETSRRLARWKLRQICGSDGDSNFYIVNATRAEATPALLQRWVQEYEIGLVVIDSLSKWWNIAEENSGVEAERGVDPALQLARRTGCGVLLIYHTTKHPKPGQSILDLFRGSGAITAALDLGIVLTKTGDSPLRKLEAGSRFDETPSVQYVELGEYVYRTVDNPKEAELTEQRGKVVSVLGKQWQPVAEIEKALEDIGIDMSDSTVRKRLKELFDSDRIEREKRGKAFHYRLKAA